MSKNSNHQHPEKTSHGKEDCHLHFRDMPESRAVEERTERSVDRTSNSNSSPPPYNNPQQHPSDNETRVFSSSPGSGGGGDGLPVPPPAPIRMDKKKKKKKRPRTDDAAVAGRWTSEEHALFLHGLAQFGREWKRVAQDIPTRSSSQVRSHAQKYFAKLAKQQQMQHQQLMHPEEVEQADDDNDDEHNAASEIVMSDSVRQQAARILAHPESVCAEVTQTLLALKERHQQLQRRLLLQQQAMQEGNPREQQRQHAVISLDNEEEMIALHVLRGGLPRPKSPHEKDGLE